MAILTGDIEFTGSIGNLSAYKLRGIEKPIIRTKGGASKKKILTAAEFQRTRENFSEFGQCGIMGGCIRRSMLPMSPLATYNFTPLLTAVAKAIQRLDAVSKRGERHVLLSQYRNLLTGFSLNLDTAFESIVRHPVTYTINRETGTATVQLPSLVPGVNLIPHRKQPLFRFLLNLGLVADIEFTAKGYTRVEDKESNCVYTGWHHTGQAFDAQEITVQLSDTSEIKDNTTLILSIGIQMGTPITDELVNPVKYGGCAKIIGVA